MKGDYLSYKRAANVSLLGLAIQLALGLVMVIYGAVWRDHVALSVAAFVLLGAIVWVTLAVLFDQHRRERLESLESEALARGGAGASVFEESGDELRVAARRLAWMHRVLVPGVSLALAALLILLGWWRLQGGLVLIKQEMDPAKFPPRGWPIALGMLLAVIGFIFARFVSGMAKQRVWENLRAGATQAVGAAVMGLALALAHFVDIAGPDAVLRYIHVVIPAVILVLGAEIVFNFILAVYRPRRAGEIARAPFYSRLLGFLAAPDRIAESIGGALNYQFGFDVTSSWFYQLLTRWVTALVAIGALVVWGMTWFTVVQPNEQGLLLRNGRLVSSTLGPGIYVKWPWPIDRVEKLPTAMPQRLDLAGPPPSDEILALLWTNDHKVKESFLLVRSLDAEPSDPAAGQVEAPGGAESEQPRTGPGIPPPPDDVRDVALINVEIPVIYVIHDLQKYQALAQDQMRQSLLQAVGRREVWRYLAAKKMDDILGAGRMSASEDLRRLVETRFSQLDAGVTVLFVGIEGVHPPLMTAFEFEKVVAGGQQREMAIEAARTEETTTLTKAVGSVALAKRIADEVRDLDDLKRRISADGGQPDSDPRVAQRHIRIEDLLMQAGGQASALIQKAKADRWKRHMGARGRAEMYQGQLAAFEAAGGIYAAQLYFHTLTEIMADARVYIVPDANIEVRTNLEEPPPSATSFLDERARKGDEE